MDHFIIATAGHVDHGKSSLVKALTGTDPDRLPEEKARGMTIDLGFAELNLGEFHVGFVDVPGHDAFVRNMIAGVGSIDLALFVIAADDGWMPQTEEHLQILSYLGVHRAIIALTKIDIGDAQKIEAQIRDQLRDTAFASSPIIPISARSGIGLENLKATIMVELSKIQPPRDIGKPRLFVDRAFKLRGIGTIITGTLTGGMLRVGETILVQPRNLSARIRSLQTHGVDVDLVQPGMRTAMNLPELELEKEIERGDVVTIAGLETSATLGVVLERSPRSSEQALKNRAQVYLHHGTARVRARVVFTNNDAIRRGQRAIAQLRLDSPVVAFLGDRFVLRDPSERFTIAGGVVLDPVGSGDEDLLRARATASGDVDLCLRTEIKRRRAAPVSSLLHQSRFSAAEVDAAMSRLNILCQDGIAIDSDYSGLLGERAVRAIDEIHRQFPERSGMELSNLRALFADQSPALLDAVIVDLTKENFVRIGSTIARRAHQPALSPDLEPIAANIRAKLAEQPFDPPNQKANDPQTRKAIRFLVGRGELVELAPNVVVRQDAVMQMKTRIEKFIAAHGSANVSELRAEIGSSRRIMVPFLEWLDRQGVTQRVGDKRVLKNAR